MPSFLNLTRILIALNLVFYCVELLTGDLLLYYFALWPVNGTPGMPAFQPWQLITYGFLHDPNSWMHIGLNMWALFMFGQDLEGVLGMKRYAGLYFTSVITAALTQLAFSWATGSVNFTVGASGAVFGVLLGFAMYFPNRTILLIIPPIPLPARVFVVLYAGLELFLGVTGSQEGVAHFAHLGGLIGAWFFLRRRR